MDHDNRTDKERILMNAIRGLYAGSLNRYECVRCGGASVPRTGKDTWGAAFLSGGITPSRSQLQRGDLVLCNTNPNHDWGVAWFVEWLDDPFGGAVLKEIGSNRLLNMGNESFTKIDGLHVEELWEQDQRQFHRKVIKATHQINCHCTHKYRGMVFPEGPGSRKALIYFSPHIFGCRKGQMPVCVEVPFKFVKRTTIKSIREALEGAGMGNKDHEFKWIEKPENYSGPGCVYPGKSPGESLC